MERNFERLDGYLGCNIHETDAYAEEIHRLQKFTGHIAKKILGEVKKRTENGSFTSEALRAWFKEHVEIFHKGEESSKLDKTPFSLSSSSVSKEDIFCVPLALSTEESVDSDIVKKSVLGFPDQHKILYIGIKGKIFERSFPIISYRYDCYVSNPYDEGENLAVVPVDMTEAVEVWGN